MSSSDKPIVAVVGATGAQGGSVVNYLLNDPDHSFRVRGLTRNIDSPKAKVLAARGVEVVKADMDDVASLRKAFEGTYGVFGVTNFWELFDEEREIQQGKNLVDAALLAGVKHFVWSSLDHTGDPVLVKHCNTKAVVDDYLKEKKIPRTSIFTVFYFENFLYLFPLKKVVGKVIADWPLMWTDGPLGGYSVTETGAYALAAFKNPNEWIGKDIRVLSQVITPRQFVQAVRDVTGKDVEIVEIDRPKFNETKESNYELWSKLEMFYITNGNPNRDPDLTLRLNPSRMDIRAFVEANKEAFLAIFNS
ncbi:NAD-binding protein [Fomitiporia mediterranea MF3/22]|uniref:NAD-binding protein n=1 Tax=Fomitiporia mediterranea (strain MF3/22) TaxID=694068 RepID=UPI0004407618|nr:NAD-binding protein [Fomitiporia mediterranea MF3/22]EJC99553.1 NAD-binding protein [Fomitiporia mediterranea MF3/22]